MFGALSFSDSRGLVQVLTSKLFGERLLWLGFFQFGSPYGDKGLRGFVAFGSGFLPCRLEGSKPEVLFTDHI